MEHPMAFPNSVSNRVSVPSVHSRTLSAAHALRSNVTSLELMHPDYERGMYRVLLAHDLTAPSEIALVRAARLALERQGHLIVLHIVDGKLPAGVVEAQRAHARSHLETEIRRWLGRSKLSYRIDIGVGEPAGAIAARAQAHRVDLVVTGRHLRRVVADTHTPATLKRLLQQIQWPLLVVGNPDQSPYRRVLMPFDLTNASAARLQFAAAFIPQARLRFLHACKRSVQDYVASLSLMLNPGKGRTGSRPIGQPKHVVSRFVAALKL